MDPIEHQIKPIKQKPSECMQTAATQMLAYYDDSIILDDVLSEVPVHVENGEKVGTSPGHLASYFPKKGYKTKAYIFDVELFDRSWRGFSSEVIADNIRKREKYIPENSWLAKYHELITTGWELFAKEGGEFVLEPLRIDLLYRLLRDGPFLLMLNSTYLNQNARQKYDKDNDEFLDDPIQGRSFTHAVTCAGYKDGKFLIIGPDPPADINHNRWIDQDHLIVSIMSAQTESDNLLISISK